MKREGVPDETVYGLGQPAGVLLIGLLTCLAYLPSLSGGFLIDDGILLTRSPLVHAPDGLWRFWFTTEAIDYWPVSNTSFWFEWRLWGTNPTGYRVTNLILHIVESVLLWKILSRLAIPGAFLAALLFAVHPVNAETVAWISQRKTLLAMLFVELSTLFYLRSERPEQKSARGDAALFDGWYVLSLAAFMLAMLSKISAVILPLLLLVVVAWLRPLGRRDAVRAAPMFLLAGAMVLVNVWYRAGDPHIQEPSTLVESVPRAASAVLLYLGKALFPLDLAFMYPVPAGAPGAWLTWLPLAALVAISALLVRYRSLRARPLLFAWVFYCVALLPALGLTEKPYIEDHYQHLALVALAALVAACWASVRGRANVGMRRALNGLAVATVATLAFLTWRHAALFTDNVVLMRAAVETYPRSAVAHRNIGFVLLEAGSSEEAIPHLEEALRLQPDLVEAHRTLAATVAASGDLERAIDHLQRAIELRPNDPEALANIGAFLRETHRTAEAIPFFERALRLYPESSRTHCNLGKALLEVGEVSSAIEHFEEASRLDPTSTEAKRLLSLALDAARGSGRRSRDRFQWLVSIDGPLLEAT